MKPRTTRNYVIRPDRGEAARKKWEPREPRDAAPAALSLKQKSALCQLARQAFDRLDALGLVDAPGAGVSARFAAWRAEQQAEAVGIASLRDCGNAHYRSLRAHFNALLGRDDVAFQDLTRTGRVRDHGPAEDTHERREELRALILLTLMEHGHRCDPARPEYQPEIARCVAEQGGLITAAYAIAIAKMKCKGKALDRLTARELEQILYTMRNRISSREGREKRKINGRNSGQGRKAVQP